MSKYSGARPRSVSTTATRSRSVNGAITCLAGDPTRGEARETVVTLRARAIVYATGAIERPLVFANNDRPGIMLASAARTYLNRYAVAAGRRALIATNNDSAYATALDLAKHGVEVTIAEQRTGIDTGLAARVNQAGVRLRPRRR